MKFTYAVHTDVGIRKATNQDSILVKHADTDNGEVFFAVICDGMGGLAKGEVASATLVRACSDWFDQVFPEIFYAAMQRGNLELSDLSQSWSEVLSETNRKIQVYGSANYASLGTTGIGMLLYNGQYFIFNVGDSRTYQIKHNVRLLSKDQTFVQREMDEGRMTPEEARVHPQQNVLLQCVGASPEVIPDFYTGQFEPDTVFMMCSDGFRHLISEEEFFSRMRPDQLGDQKNMKETLVYFTELNKQRNEKDNISVLLVRTG